MGRRIAVGGSAILSVVAALGAGCGSDGNYQVTWKFFASQTATGPEDSTKDAFAVCGAHGVDAIQVSAVSSGGGRHQATGLCTQGQLAAGIGLGQWQFTFSQVDAKGDVIALPDKFAAPEASAEVESNKTADLGLIKLVPQAACTDGIDNDQDGRVDLDDPDCGGDPEYDSESTPLAASR